MSNLGLYQKMTTCAKRMGGVIPLTVTVMGVGYIVIRPVEAGVKKLYKLSKNYMQTKKLSVQDMPVVDVHTGGIDEQGLSFQKGDQYRILEKDGEAVLIEKIGDSNNPYVVSGIFLKTISEY